MESNKRPMPITINDPHSNGGEPSHLSHVSLTSVMIAMQFDVEVRGADPLFAHLCIPFLSCLLGFSNILHLCVSLSGGWLLSFGNIFSRVPLKNVSLYIFYRTDDI